MKLSSLIEDESYLQCDQWPACLHYKLFVYTLRPYRQDYRDLKCNTLLTCIDLLLTDSKVVLSPLQIGFCAPAGFIFLLC